MWVFWVKDQGGGISWFPHLGIGGSETSCFAMEDFLVCFYGAGLPVLVFMKQDFLFQSLRGRTSSFSLYRTRLPVLASMGLDFLF